MKILLHLCCANCLLYPIQTLQKEEHEVLGFFYNPNIHPYQEYVRRLEAVRLLEGQLDLKIIYRDSYDLEDFIRQVVFREKERCRLCYYMRMKETARVARHGKFSAFSSTLLASRHQDHGLIKAVAKTVEEEEGIPFYYSDFRGGWKEGVEMSRRLGLYRQQYCGCIYSEKERYLK